MGLFFLVLKKVGLFRVSPEVEAQGLDVSHHGERQQQQQQAAHRRGAAQPTSLPADNPATSAVAVYPLAPATATAKPAALPPFPPPAVFPPTRCRPPALSHAPQVALPTPTRAPARALAAARAT